MVLAGRVGFKWGLSLNVPLDVQACCCNLYSIVTAGDLNTLPPWLVNCNQEWVLITFQQRLLVFSYSSVSSLAQLSAGNRVLSEPPAAVSKHVTQRLCNWFFLFHWVWVRQMIEHQFRIQAFQQPPHLTWWCENRVIFGMVTQIVGISLTSPAAHPDVLVILLSAVQLCSAQALIFLNLTLTLYICLYIHLC